MVLRNAFANLSSEDDIEELAQLLSNILNRTPYLDPATGGSRTNVINTPNVSVTNTPSIATVSTVTNQAQTGGLYTNSDQYTQFQIGFQYIRNRITVT